MRSSTLTRILALFTGLLLVAVLIFGVLFMKQRLAAPKTAETAAASEDPVEHNWNGPFDLRTVTSRIGSQTYLSFAVYYRHDGEEELWYSCGRMFPSGDVKSIGWEGAQFDIAVQLKNGTKELFSYDGNGEWL